MKYVVFFAFAFAAVPLMTLFAAASQPGKRMLLALLVMSPMFGNDTNINFWSLESYRGTDRGFEVTLTDLIAVSLGAALLIRRSRPIVWLPRNGLLLALFFACGCASLLASPVPVHSSFTLFKLLRCGLLYWVVVNIVTSLRDVRAMLWGWTIAGLLMALVAGVQKYAQGVYRVSGPFDHSNTIPPYLNLVLALVVIWGLVDEELRAPVRMLVLASAIGMVFAVLATFSRAGIVLTAGAFVAAVFVSLCRAPSRGSTMTALVGMLLVIAGGVKAAPRVIERFVHAAAESHEAREEFNVAAWLMASDSVCGVGINAFSEVMSTEARYREHVLVMAHEVSAGVAHNIYLLTAAELGYAALALYLAVIGRFLWIGLRCALRRATLESLLAAGACLGMICLHLSGFLEWAFRITPVTYQFAMVCGLVVGLATPMGSARRVPTNPLVPARRSRQHVAEAIDP